MALVGSNEARWVDDEQRGMVLSVHFLFEVKGLNGSYTDLLSANLPERGKHDQESSRSKILRINGHWHSQ